MSTTLKVLQLICDRLDATGHSLSVHDLAHQLDCSPATAHHIVRGLIEQGYLEQAGTTKSLMPTHQGLLQAGRI